MKRKNSLYVKDILEAIKSIDEFTRGMDYADFRDDDKTASAVIRKLEIIGEAVKNIPQEIRQMDKEIPWTYMAKTRDKIIHGYFGIDHDIIWKTIRERLPTIKAPLKSILKKLREKEQ
jgi:uncharacterized protein with HEPN domain